MLEYPKILINPEDTIFNIDENEQYLLKEANELIHKEHFSYSLYAIWSCVIMNLQKRIEFFGIKNFINHTNSSTSFDENAHNLKDRWLNVNEYQIITYAKELQVISYIAHDLVTCLYWMKTNSTEVLNKEEIFSIVYLLEKQLFIKTLKKDLRRKKSENNPKRRKNDTFHNLNIQSKTHNELILKTQVNGFQQQLEEAKKRASTTSIYN